MLFLMDTAQARALAAQLKQSPQDRDQRISALQRAMAEGTYQASPEQTAEAMLDEQQVRDGTAA
jgi:anti-sigma28 factor (negative regulator of flagellin synthesis)